MLQTSRVALVTGASRGIGQAIALALGHQGLIMVGTATTEDGAQKISHSFKEQNIQGCGIVMNVLEPVSLENAFTLIKERYSMPLVLVNNAAVTQDNIMLRMKEGEWDKVIETNLNSLYRVTRACLRDMIKARWGRIINIGSVVGSTGNVGQVNYATAKAGLIGFTKALALEVGSREVTVNAVSPGFINTDMTRSLSDDQRQALVDRIPLQRIGNPEEVAAAVAFLVSEVAGYITGQTLHVNGGMYMV
jgi:3-oxoacyl-[acyl-carrier protein] reductase